MMKNRLNMELLDFISNGSLLDKELAKEELNKRVEKYARAVNGNIHLQLGFIPKRGSEDEIVIKRFDGFYKMNDSAMNGIRIQRDEQNKIIWFTL